MKKQDYLYCYIMTHDTGFAPNPEHGFLTLATCKPTIRRCAEIGTWISGWAGVKVYTSQDRKQYVDGKAQQLIYLAKITDKISFMDYWNGERFKDKQPSCSSDCGDNIYRPIEGKENEFYDPIENGGGHGIKEKQHDLSGKTVLICDEFYYFGVQSAIDVMSELNNKSFVVPRCKKLSMTDDMPNRIIEIVRNHLSQAMHYSRGN